VLQKLEQETVICYNREDDNVSIYTASAIDKRRCEKLGFKLESVNRDEKGNEMSWDYSVSKKEFRWGKKKTIKPLSEEERKIMAWRLKENIKKSKK